ncbi:hypothetical protein Tco_1250730 [Tanacetum coccineum]
MLVTRQGMNSTAIEKLIAQGVADAMTAYEANRASRNGTHNESSGSARGVKHTICNSSYKEFLTCKPYSFKEMERAVGFTCWFEKMESVFYISTCVKNCQFPVIHQPPHETSVEILQARENLMKSIQTFLKKFNHISFRETPNVLFLAWEKFFEIKHACGKKQHQPEDIQDILRKLLNDVQIISEELADYINTPNWNCPAFYEDDDEEYTIAITPVLPTEEPDNSLSMGDEHLNTILKTESDGLIKSSVENLVPIYNNPQFS